MPTPQIVSLPPDFDFMDGMQIIITAVDATTNATVSGVTISQVSIDVDPADRDEPLELTPVDGPFAFGDIAA